MGGGTGLIGDPSGKESERPVLDRDQIRRNVASQRKIFERLLRFDGENAAVIFDNADWLEPLTFVTVLRDIGKHFSVNMMIQKESVRARLESREQGISYTEFSYMLLQAYDFVHLFDSAHVTIQAAGSDQWGNIVAGVELARRTRQVELYGITAPLVTRADGGKFGKSEAGAIWLTADRTSAYAFYQFWLNTADADVEKYLKTFTLLDHEAIEGVLAEQRRSPEDRAAQRALAAHVTELVHGETEAAHAKAAAQALFSGEVGGLPESTLNEVFANAPSSVHPVDALSGDGLSLVELLVETNVAKSKREAREFLANGAVSINGHRVGAEERLKFDHLLHGKVALIRRGKKTWHVARWK